MARLARLSLRHALAWPDSPIKWPPRRTLRGRSIAWAIQEIENELPPRQREAAHLYFRFGLSEEAVAGEMGISHQAVSELVRKILKKLRQGACKNVLG